MTLNINSHAGDPVEKPNEIKSKAIPITDSIIPVIGIQKDVFTKSPEPLKDANNVPIMLADNENNQTDSKCNYNLSQSLLGLIYGYDKVTYSMLEQRQEALNKGCKIKQEKEKADAQSKEYEKARKFDLEAKKKALGYEENGIFGFFKSKMWCKDAYGKSFYCEPECTFNQKTSHGEYVYTRSFMKDLGYNEQEYQIFTTVTSSGIEKYTIVKRSN